MVRWLGNCFRHPSMIISLLYSLPLDGRLAALRSRGAERPLSPFADNYWLTQVGLDVDLLFSGRPRVRGASGQAIRWGASWFGQIRDGGVGLCFDRNDGQEVTIRTQMILKLFRRARNESAPALEDVVIPICDG